MKITTNFIQGNVVALFNKAFSKIFFSIIIFQIVSFSVVAQNESDFILDKVRKLNRIKTNFQKEQIFIHTDKFHYLPGETLWFKAYICETVFNKPSDLSKKLFIQLLDENGKQLLENMWEINQGVSFGNFTIPENMSDQNIWLVAYSSWMLNGDQPFYCQKIVVSKTLLPKLFLKLKLNEPVLNKNEFYATATVFDRHALPKKNTELKFNIKSGNKLILKNVTQTGIDEKAVFPVKLSESKTQNDISLTVETFFQGEKPSVSLNIPGLHDSVDFRFYPEGGELLNDIKCKVGFEIRDKAGIPFNIKGELFEDDHAILSFSSAFKGMGSFSFTPHCRKKYSVRIQEPKNISENFNLPVVKENGIALAVDTVVNDSLKITVSSTNTAEFEKIQLVVHMRNEVYHGIIIKISGRTTLSVPIKEMPMGIAQITVFNELKEPVAERLVFVNKNKKLHIKVNGLKENYVKREKTDVNISVFDENGLPVSANLSVSVIDKVSLSIEPLPSVITDFTIANELSRNIFMDEYVYSSGQFSDKALEYILLTHGWRKYAWKKIEERDVNGNPFYNRDGIEGIVYDDKGRVFPHARVILSNLKEITSYANYSDESGRFYFPFSLYNCADEFIAFRAMDTATKKNLVIKLNDENATNFLVSALSNKRLNPSFLQSNYSVIPSESSDVYDKIKFVNLASGKFSKEQNIDKHWETRNSILDIIKEIKNYQIMDNKIIFPGNLNSFLNLKGAVFVLDGVALGDDIEIANNIPTNDVEDIKILTDPLDVQRYSSFYCNGVIEIKTKKGIGFNDQINHSESFKNSQGFYIAKEFYSPKYAQNKKLKKTDLRTTIYWTPLLNIDSTGCSKIDYYNGDITGEKIMIIQGVSPDGLAGYAQFSYSVKKD